MAGNSLTIKEADEILRSEGLILKRRKHSLNHLIYEYNGKNLVIRSQRYINRSTLYKKIKEVKKDEIL